MSDGHDANPLYCLRCSIHPVPQGWAEHLLEVAGAVLFSDGQSTKTTMTPTWTNSRTPSSTLCRERTNWARTRMSLC